MAPDNATCDLEANSEAVVELTYPLGSSAESDEGEIDADAGVVIGTEGVSSGEAEQRHCLGARFAAYASKFFGVEGKTPPPHSTLVHSIFSGVLSFVSILLLSIVDYYFLTVRFEVQDYDVVMLSGAQAATAVLLYEAYQSPLAQPRNVIGSYTICSIVGVSVRIVLGDMLGLQTFVLGGLAVGISIFTMNMTNTVHPPGGACALLAIIGSENLKAMEFGYVLTSMGAAILMVAVAVLGNNLLPWRQYPLYWN